MKAERQTFSNATIIIDGNEYLECKFERCKIVYCGVAVVALNGCSFSDCEWSFDGPAARTVQFMSALYASGGGAKELIEQTLRNIRGKPQPGAKSN